MSWANLWYVWAYHIQKWVKKVEQIIRQFVVRRREKVECDTLREPGVVGMDVHVEYDTL